MCTWSMTSLVTPENIAVTFAGGSCKESVSKVDMDINPLRTGILFFIKRAGDGGKLHSLLTYIDHFKNRYQINYICT